MSEGRARTFDPSKQKALAEWLARVLGARSVDVVAMELLSGGAVQENWHLAVVVEGGRRAGAHSWVLRTDAAARLGMSLDRTAEYRCIEAAYAAGAKVPEPIALHTDEHLIGAPFSVQSLVSGVAQARRIVRDPALPKFGEKLAAEAGGELARIHSIRPRDGLLPMLPLPMGNPNKRAVAELQAALADASEPRPALDYILVWLAANAPAPRHITLVHGDYRTGNYLVDDGRLMAVLDWEFTHWGDPREDLGWFIARCWRFGNDAKVAGGIGRLGSFLDGYNASADVKVDAGELQYFEVLAAARWAVISLRQGDRFLRGGEQSLELALTGLMPPEMEFDALEVMDKIDRGVRA